MKALNERIIRLINEMWRTAWRRWGKVGRCWRIRGPIAQVIRPFVGRTVNERDAKMVAKVREVAV